ncbi:MFS transporter [Marinomonas posidonica]|uniref:Major facilitator superfamily MFS_1 n=1 Tax=Marinomonas posidonica (strain CECT 7376 / NCIMB 14433 / IVIA-Po-181) TaxID=491952 RepID=F6CVU2_MARPP|nr:MFS transporter [Marinomonas posidonica]AEF53150.1 major facilitator superfamily MFS_1 [Marinomonas posidonica IVIA-Po-181]
MNTKLEQAQQTHSFIQHATIWIIFTRVISDFAGVLNLILLSSYVFFISQNVFTLSLFMASSVAGGILASLVSFFSIKPHKHTLSLLNTIRLILLLILVLIPTHQQINVLPWIALIGGFCNALFMITLNSQIPLWVEKSKRISTNAWLTALSAIASVIAGLSIGLLVAVGGYEGIFIFNIVLYSLVGLSLLTLSTIQPIPDHQNAPDAQRIHPFRLFDRPLQSPFLGWLFAISTASSLACAAQQVGFPVLSQNLTPHNISYAMGLLMSAWGIGKFIGASKAGFYLKDKALLSLENGFCISCLIMSCGFVLTFQQSLLSWAIVLVCLAGIGEGGAEVSLTSSIQLESKSLHLILFSALAFMKMVASAIGALLVSPFYALFDLNVVILLFHALPIALIVLKSIRKHSIKVS